MKYISSILFDLQPWNILIGLFVSFYYYKAFPNKILTFLIIPNLLVTVIFDTCRYSKTHLVTSILAILLNLFNLELNHNEKVILYSCIFLYILLLFPVLPFCNQDIKKPQNLTDVFFNTTTGCFDYSQKLLIHQIRAFLQYVILFISGKQVIQKLNES